MRCGTFGTFGQALKDIHIMAQLEKAFQSSDLLFIELKCNLIPLYSVRMLYLVSVVGSTMSGGECSPRRLASVSGLDGLHQCFCSPRGLASVHHRVSP